MKTPSSEKLLKQHQRWQNYAWPLLILVLGLGVTLAEAWRRHFSLARVESWEDLPMWWAGGLLLTVGVAFAVWLVCRKQILDSAKGLDEKLEAKNRIETAMELQGDSSPIARAQREETAEFLTPVQPKQRPLLILFVLVWAVFALHLATLLTWTRPWESFAPSSAAKEEPPKVPQASIQWKSPNSETRAAAVEEVPLEALADSTSGLKNLVLHAAVNGEPRMSEPIQADAAAKPGKHGISASLYLDQLQVEPFDIVSYYIIAQRIDERKLPETVSPVQFVQVQPFRDDVREVPLGGKNEIHLLVMAVKAAQLRLIKQNFVLAHADVERENAEWQKENARVGGDQGILEAKVGELIQKMITEGAEAELVNLMSQAQPLMGEAAQKLSVMENTPALAPQGKALGLITSAEKFFQKQKAPKSTPDKKVSDPFADKKMLELKQRLKTEAGELELLAKEQARLGDDLGKDGAASAKKEEEKEAKPDPNRIDGTLAERQAQISQRLGALLNGKVFQPEVTQHLEKGREFAGESLKHLDAEDPAAAREPTNAALRELNLALKIMNRAGEEEAKEELLNSLRALNTAADAARSAPQQTSEEVAKAQVETAQEEAKKVAQRLAEAAQKQQQSGSEKAAERMNALARSIASEGVQKALDELRAQPKNETAAKAAADRLQKLADLAANQKNGEKLSPGELGDMVGKLERARANLQKLAKEEAKGSNGKEKGTEGEAGKEPGKQESGEQPGEGNGSKPKQESAAKADSESSGGDGDKQATSSESKPSSSEAGSIPGTNAKPALGDQFARDLVEDIREGMQVAQSVLNNAEAMGKVRELIEQKPRNSRGDVVDLYTSIDPPLGEVIQLLRAELKGVQREHQLSEQSMETAPAAYRSAVSDYFERLSRDYESEN